MMEKRSVYVFSFLILMLIVVPFASANIFADFFGKITGKATFDTEALNITVGNAAPTIDTVTSITAKNPTDDTVTSIEFNFTATDTDGGGNINTSSAESYFQRSGETTRSNLTCQSGAPISDDVEFNCVIDMLYFDENGAWTVNVTVRDNSQATAENSSTTFVYNLLPGVKLSPTSLTWSGVGLGSANVEANEVIVLNNTGNEINLSIEVTGIDLQGEITSTQFIFAENFTVENKTGTCTGTAMVNASSTNVTSANLQRGNHTINNEDDTSGQEQIYVCLEGVPQDISSQSYSSAGLGAWTVTIVA